MREGYWMIRTYQAGNVGEKTKYFVPGARPDNRSKRKEKDAVKKAEQNEYSAQKALARLINANFGKGDIFLGLDYSEEALCSLLSEKDVQDHEEESEGEQEEQLSEVTTEDRLRARADHEMKLCIRRVKRDMKAAGLELRYIAITSDMNGKTGEFVRVHHHLIVPKEALPFFQSKWNLGGVHYSPMSRQDDYTPIAEYLIKQVRRIPDAHKYISSRNLIRPEPKDRIAQSDSELRIPHGAKLLHRSVFVPGQPQYVRYIVPDKQKVKQQEDAKETE